MEREALPALTLDAVPALANEGALVAIGLGERGEDQREALVGEVEGVVAMRRLSRRFRRNRGHGFVVEETKLDFHDSQREEEEEEEESSPNS